MTESPFMPKATADWLVENTTLTYKQIAEAIGHPKSYRAVANACGKNPYPETIPCHRVVKSDGTIGGYSPTGGVDKKSQLLRMEI